ncbi:uncharacterized protein BP5553_05747 [Venustampulla echinocandica]|uniref:Uncharacterized protein n=1 Tax=Venustampulla echinocandica TaxID=2656787 RepID=A0A370TLK3_9HELO|nr:uncharacterized protein BP5553_05747 [Venustampulla echinocandica]RDL36395.1 hypothetical protein BP5553_05747 [Venustampulla echinocandica]
MDLDGEFVEVLEEDFKEWPSSTRSRAVDLGGISGTTKVVREHTVVERRAFTKELKEFQNYRPDQDLDDDELEQRATKLISPLKEEFDAFYMDPASPMDEEQDIFESTRINPFGYSNPMADYDFLEDESTCSFEGIFGALNDAFGELDVEGYIADATSGEYEMEDHDDIRFPEAGLEDARETLLHGISTCFHFSRQNCKCDDCREENQAEKARRGLREAKDYLIEDSLLKCRIEMLLHNQEKQTNLGPRPGEQDMDPSQRAEEHAIRLSNQATDQTEDEINTFLDLNWYLEEQSKLRRRFFIQSKQ